MAITSSSSNLFIKKFSLLFMLCLIYFFTVLGRIIFSPLTLFISSDLNIGSMETGNMFLMLSIGFGISLFFSQFISSYLSHKTTILCSSFFLSFSLIFSSFCSSWHMLLISLFFIGLSSGMFLPSSVAIITASFPQNKWGQAFSIFSMSQSSAFILAPLIIQTLSPFFSWQKNLFFLGWLIFFSSIWIFFSLDHGKFKGEAISFSFLKTIISFPSFWAVLFLLCVITGLNVGIYNMSPDFFSQNKQISTKQINFILSLSRFLGLIALFLSGKITDSFGLKKALVFGLFLCGGMTALMGIVSPFFSLFLLCIQSPFALCLNPMIHIAISNLSPPGKNAAMVSLISSIGYLVGSGVIPQALGFFGAYNLYSFGFILFGLFAIASGFILQKKASSSTPFLGLVKTVDSFE